MITSRLAVVAGYWMLTSQAALAAAPSMDDYAQGVAITAAGADRPLIETTVPDVVYQKVTRADLGDMRVFNTEGAVVPHAFCAAPESTATTYRIHSLPVFDLRDIERLSPGARIEVQTAGGTQVNVAEPGVEPAERAAVTGRTHIIDARGVRDPLRAVQFEWQSPDGASEARVRIESSEDLDQWTVVVPESTLLFVRRGSQHLERERIELPQRRYSYLRVARVDSGPPLLINVVTGEGVQAGADIEPLWFMATVMESADATAPLFDSERLAPIRYARLRLPQENSAARVTLESRVDEKSQWHERWSGEVYLIITPERRESAPARFAPTTDREWRVRIHNGQQSYQGAMLELGYRPTRVRFLAQGNGPFTLAFGSRRAEPAVVGACDALLADVGAAERATLIVEGFASSPRALGGDTAFKALPRKTPVRLVVLWSVLVVGVALLVAMALSLLKRVRS